MNDIGNGILTKLESMVPELRARGNKAEKEGRIPEETLNELDISGAMKSVVPKSAGGYEVDFPFIPQIFRVLGKGCVATSWTMGFLIYHNFQFAHFPEKTQIEVFGSRGYTMAPGVIVPSGMARPVAGGFELSGEWRWLTGILHADWVLFSAPVIEEGETEDNIGHHGRDLRRFCVPVEDCEIINTWDVSAMSSSGSHDMRLNKVFVPEHHQIKVATVANRTSPGLKINTGPLWQVPFITFASLGAVGPMIGGTEGILEMTTEILKTKFGAHTGNQQQKLMTQQVRIARLTTSLKALIKLWEDELNFVWDKVTRGVEITLEERVEARMIVAHCAKGCDDIANELVVAAGSRSIYKDSHIQRFRREINALATHAFFDHDHLASLHGSILLGLTLPPNTMV